MTEKSIGTIESMGEAERMVHDLLRQTAQSIMDKHDICIHDVRFSWADVSSAGQRRMLVSGVAVQTETKHFY